jgi:hypothetical protein
MNQGGMAMLSGRISKEELSSSLLSKEEWHPYPTIAEREPWQNLPADTRRDFIDKAEDILNSEWPVITAALYMDFQRTGSRRCNSLYWNRRGRLALLAFAECVEDRGRFIDEIINGIWMICEESTWCFSSHLSGVTKGQQRLLPDVSVPAVDESTHSTAHLLAWMHYLLKSRLDDVAPVSCERIVTEVKHRALKPYNENDDISCLGFGPSAPGRPIRVNNHNPWMNTDVLVSTLILEDDHQQRVATVERAMRSLDVFIGMYQEEGGCEEGPGYWRLAAGRLFAGLEFLHSATNGKIDIFGEPLIQNMGRFIYYAHISNGYFVNFADSHAKPGVDPKLMIRYGKKIGDENLVNLGVQLATSGSRGRTPVRKYGTRPVGEGLAMLFKDDELLTPEESKRRPFPHVRDIYLGDIQLMVAREKAGTDKGLYLSVKGGHNGTSHNHNDVGNFIVYYDGHPVMVDPGMGEYTRQTFSSGRYDLWTMQSAYHNLPTIDGQQQKAGSDLKASDVNYEVNEDRAQLAMDIASAYSEEADVSSWKRTARLNRGDEVSLVIRDEFALGHKPGSLTLSLLTPCGAKADGEDIILNSETGEVRVEFATGTFQISTEEIRTADDESLSENWGDHLTRILLQAREPRSKGIWELRITGEGYNL